MASAVLMNLKGVSSKERLTKLSPLVIRPRLRPLTPSKCEYKGRGSSGSR